MATMKQDLTKEQDAADEWLVKKIRYDEGVQFKHKANEKQHRFNEELQDKIEAAQRSV